MTTTNTGARSTRASGRSTAEKAKAESNGHKTIALEDPMFQGLVLEGPSVLPPTFSWDLAELGEADDELTALRLSRRLLVSVIGPEQADDIRAKIAENASRDEYAGGEVFSAVLRDLLKAYGTDEGESDASA